MIRIIVIFALAAATQAQVLKTICNSGCDYTGGQLQTALNDAQQFQDGSQCLPYVIEINVATTISGHFLLPNKACRSFVTVRSNRMDALPDPGTRIDPAVHAPYLATISEPPDFLPIVATNQNGHTGYWRFTGINFAGPSYGMLIKQYDPGSGAGSMTVNPVTAPGTRYGTHRVVCTSGPCQNGSGTFTVYDQDNVVEGTTTQGAAFATQVSFTITNITSPIAQGDGWTLFVYTPYFLLGFGIDFNGNLDTEAALVPHHIEIERSWIHGFDNMDFPKQGVHFHVANGIIRDSRIEEIHRFDSDAAGILIYNTNGPESILNNYIAATGQSVMTGGTDGGAVSRATPQNVTIAGNWLERPYKWYVNGGTTDPAGSCFADSYFRNTASTHEFVCSQSLAWVDQGARLYPSRLSYPIKPHVECKTCLGVYVYGNYMDNGWLPHRVTGVPLEQVHNFLLVNQVDNQAGCCGQYTRPESVYFYWNRLERGIGLFTGGSIGSGYIFHIRDMHVEHNLMTNAADPRAVQGYSAQVGRLFGFTSLERDVTIRNNTLVLAPGGASTLLGFGGSGGARSIGGSIVISNNVASHGFYGIAADNLSPNGACTLKKLLDPSGAFEIEGNALTVESQSGGTTAGDVCATDYLYPTGNVFPANGAAAVDASNGYHVKPPYQNIGTDGRDPGPNLDLLTAATAHAQDGLPNPFLLFHLGGAARTSSTATLYFTAPSSNACTVDVSLTNTYGTGVGSVSQTREGRSGRAGVTGLNAGTRYYYRVTCDTWKLESTFVTAP